MRKLIRLAVIFLLSFCSLRSSAQTFAVSLPSLRLQLGERITAFQINITSARIASLPNTPIGWFLEVNNDPSWRTSIKGNIIVGGAALDANSLRPLLRIEKEPGSDEPILLAGQLMVTVYDKQGNEHTRTIELKSADFRLVATRSGTANRTSLKEPPQILRSPPPA
jgi:hypothetical protein